MPQASSPDTLVGRLPGETNLLAASVRTGRKLLTAIDDFVHHQSSFDRQARLNLTPGAVTVSRDVYLDYVASQVLTWSSDEIVSLKTILRSVAEKFSRFRLRLPKRVYLVKTTGLEEGYAAYTRQDNVIVLPANMVASLRTAADFGDPLHPASDLSYLEDVVIHECFHIFSKNNPAARKPLYALVNYQMTGNEIVLPDCPWGDPDTGITMRDLKITNPDTPVLNVYIEMIEPHRGNP